MNRRTFVKSSIVAAASLAAGKNSPAADTPVAPPAAKEQSPTGKLCGKEVSRLLLGGNLLTHFTHSRELRYVYNLCAHYNTDAKIAETLEVAEAHGVNTLVIHTVPRALSVLKEHRRRGGKMKWIICPTAAPGTDEYAQVCKQLVDDGTEFIYLWGVQADKFAAADKADMIAKAVETIKDHDVPCGVGAHDLKVIELCEEKKIPADFYIKTFHHHNYKTGPKPDQLEKPHSEIPGYWCQNPERTIEVMAKVKKPWIAFKVMAAGAIPPENAFNYVFQNGADFSLAGMFDFEIAPDVRIANKVLASIKTRARPWYG
ncbi:MAG: hypothetical protein FJ395_21775 [Verrucomicrobia bacterium]|nr:hypothetical protein [Verrucomicrobiota bacterium]